MISQRKAKEEAGSKLEEAYRKIRIYPYMRSPTQEFARPAALDRIELEEVSTSWDNFGNYNNFRNYDNYGNYNSTAGYSVFLAKDRKGKPISLENTLATKMDSEEYGFIFNMKNEMVFVANKETIEFINAIMKMPLQEVIIDYPELSNKLKLELRL